MREAKLIKEQITKQLDNVQWIKQPCVMYDYTHCAPQGHENYHQFNSVREELVVQCIMHDSVSTMIEKFKRFSVVVVLEDSIDVHPQGFMIRYFGFTENTRKRILGDKDDSLPADFFVGYKPASDCVQPKKIEMNNYIYIGDRQCGKTTKSLDKFMENPTANLFVARDVLAANGMFERLQQMYNLEDHDTMKIRKRFVSIQAPAAFCNIHASRVIFDEFFYMPLNMIKQQWDSMIPCIRREGDHGISLYSSLREEGHDMKEAQELFIDNFVDQGWKKIVIKGGKLETYKKEIIPFPFNNSI